MMSNILRDGQLGNDLYFDYTINYTQLSYCPTTAEGSYSGGAEQINVVDPAQLPTGTNVLTCGGSYIVDYGGTFYSPGIRINSEDISQCNGDTKKLLKNRKAWIGEPMYLEVYVRSHAQFMIKDRVIKMYVAEVNDICLPGNWRMLNSVKDGKEGGPAILLGEVNPGSVQWTPYRFRYLRMSTQPFYLIAQITDVTGQYNPLPDSLMIDPNLLQNRRNWSFLSIMVG